MTHPLHPQERIRFIRFMIVGCIGAFVDFGIFNLLVQLIHVLPVIASVVSFVSAVISNFIWNRYWTYSDSRSKPILSQMIQFTIVNVIGLIIRTPLFAFLENPLGKFFNVLNLQLPFSSEFLGHNSALAIAVGTVMLWNFFINRYWTYNDVKSKEKEPNQM